MEEKIINYICQYFDVDSRELKGNSKKRDVYTPRRFCMLFLQTYCKLSTTEISRYFNRTRSTVSQTITKLQNELELYKDTRQQFHEIDRYIREHIVQWQKEVIPKSETFELLLNKLPISPYEKNLWRMQFYKGTAVEGLK